MRTAECAQRGHGRWPADPAACTIIGDSSDSYTQAHRQVAVSKSHVSFMKVVSPWRPPNMSSCVPMVVSVADCRCSGAMPTGCRCRHPPLLSARSLSSTQRSLNSPSWPWPPKT